MAIQFTLGRFKPIALSLAVTSALVSQSAIAKKSAFHYQSKG